MNCAAGSLKARETALLRDLRAFRLRLALNRSGPHLSCRIHHGGIINGWEMLALLGGYFVLQLWVLPKMGVST
ncbi:MAG: hypothetical protein ACI9MR_004955 [Myxococcota bacterium]|jgi:hypothetical protein